jgi:hypothetical protein
VWSLFADRAAPIKSKWGCAIAIKEDIKKPQSCYKKCSEIERLGNEKVELTPHGRRADVS